MQNNTKDTLKMELQGRIKHISATQTFGANGFQKREIVITTEEQYPQYVLFDFTQDKCALLDQFRLGQLVKISFNVRGREWVNPQGETKYIVNLQGWRIEDLEAQQQAYYQQQPPQYQQYPPQQFQQQQYGNPAPNYGAGQQFQQQTPPPPPAFTGGFETTQASSSEEFDDLPF